MCVNLLIWKALERDGKAPIGTGNVLYLFLVNLFSSMINFLLHYYLGHTLKLKKKTKQNEITSTLIFLI